MSKLEDDKIKLNYLDKDIINNFKKPKQSNQYLNNDLTKPKKGISQSKSFIKVDRKILFTMKIKINENKFGQLNV